MKVNINEIGMEMALLNSMKGDLDKADAYEDGPDGVYLHAALTEVEKRIEHLQKTLVFERPKNMREVLILALTAASIGQQMGPTPLNKLFKNCPAELRRNAGGPPHEAFSRYMEPVLRLLDAIITGIETKHRVTREDLHLEFLRPREGDAEKVYDLGLEALDRRAAAAAQTDEVA